MDYCNHSLCKNNRTWLVASAFVRHRAEVLTEAGLTAAIVFICIMGVELLLEAKKQKCIFAVKPDHE